MAAEAASPEQSATPLVFLTVGTDHHPFDRLVHWVDAWASERDVRVVAQFGTAAPPQHVDGAAMLRADELGRLMARSVAVVCHGGPGTIAAARDAGTIPIVVPRRPDLGEHVDDHQMRFVARLAETGAVHAPTTEAELRELLDRALADPVAFSRDDDDEAAAAEASVRRFGQLVDDVVSGAEPSSPVPVLFVAGWGRSGSTLLARLLGQVPGVFSAGELRDVWLRGAIEDRLCGCGETFRACALWREVGERAFGGWDRLDVAEVQRLRMRLDRPWLPPRLLGSRFAPALDADLLRYRDHLAALYRAIADVTGARVIVDSSKIPTYAMLLRGLPGVDLRVLHLVRDSRGVVFSWQKRVRRTDGAEGEGDDEMFRYGAASASARYLYYNGLAHALKATRVPYRLLRYEDLLEAPERHLRDTLSFAGRAPADGEFGFLHGGHAELAPNHTVDGNPMRLQQGPVLLRIDDAWRRQMGVVDRTVVSSLTAPLLAAYRYPVSG
jgi:UDP-N-acetylglucosamine transferase subunit ALG13